MRRQIKILFVISRRRFETMANLAQEFKVSFCTIRNDVKQLKDEFPIYAQPGKGGGVYAMEDWYFGKNYLKPEQEEFLIGLLSDFTGKKLEILKSILIDLMNPKSLNKAVIGNGRKN